MRRTIISCFALLVLVLVSPAFSYSLAGDWSDAINPNGPWSYNAGSIPLTYNIAGWPMWEFGQEQTAWAFNNGSPTVPSSFLPGWFKSVLNPDTVLYDWLAGDVIVHSTNAGDGADPFVANVTWTNSFSGLYNINGGFWEGRDVGRSNFWKLYLDGDLLANGVVASGDIYSRDIPDIFNIHDVYIEQGSVLKIEINKTSTSPYGDFVGVNFNIDPVVAPVPEPASLILFGIGGAGLALRKHFKKSA